MSTFRTDDMRGPLMRISFAYQMFTPREQTDDNGKKKEQFGCTLILPKTDAGWAPLIDMVKRAAKGGFGGEEGVEKLRKGLLHNPILPGDGPQAHTKDGELRSGMGPDVQFIRPIAYRKPQVYNSKLVLLAQSDDCPSGYWGYPVLNAFTWDAGQKRGISFGISMFQVIKADELLGGSGPRDPGAYFEHIDTSEAISETAKPASAASMFD